MSSARVCNNFAAGDPCSWSTLVGVQLIVAFITKPVVYYLGLFCYFLHVVSVFMPFCLSVCLSS